MRERSSEWLKQYKGMHKKLYGSSFVCTLIPKYHKMELE